MLHYELSESSTRYDTSHELSYYDNHHVYVELYYAFEIYLRTSGSPAVILL